jgi:cytoskeletal protein CcmA (bactofilin family)
MAINIPVLEEIIEGKITTIIADDLEIKGTIKFKSSVMLKGIFEGEIQSEGLLVVGPTAKVTATITTKTLVSHGVITGNVAAGEQIVLKGTATHNGDLKAPFITIDSGAVFNGAATMERRQETEETSVETNEEKPVAVSETPTYEPFVAQTAEGKQAPFVITRHDPNKKQSKDKTPLKEWEKAEDSVDFTETT